MSRVGRYRNRTPLRSLFTREADGRRSGSTALTTAISTWVNSPQPTPRSGGYSQRPEVFSEKFSSLLSLLCAGPFTRKEGSRGSRVVDADRILREDCRGALGATTHNGSTSKGDADVTTTVTGDPTETCAFRAARSTYWCAEWPLRTLHALLSLWAGRIAYWFAAAAHTLHTLLPLLTAVEAFATVILVSIKVYAPNSAAGLAFRAATNLVVPAPYAVLRAALGVPPAFPSQTPAIVGPGYPRHGGQGSS
jgi:hypothetical protein